MLCASDPELSVWPATWIFTSGKSFSDAATLSSVSADSGFSLALSVSKKTRSSTSSFFGSGMNAGAGGGGRRRRTALRIDLDARGAFRGIDRCRRTHRRGPNRSGNPSS